MAGIRRSQLVMPICGLIVLELAALYLTYRLVGSLLSAASGGTVSLSAVVGSGVLLVAKSAATFAISSHLYTIFAELEQRLRQHLVSAAESARSPALRSRSVETISHEINVYPHNIAYGVVQQASRLFTDGVLAASVLIVLLLGSPVMTLCVTLLLGVIGLLLGGQMLRMSRRYGKICDEGTVALVNHMGRYFSGRNEIESGPSKIWFRRESDTISRRLVRARARFNFITLVPRLAFDSAVGAALVLVVVVAAAGIGTLGQTDLAMGLAGALKLAPYLSSIVAILMQLGFSRAIIDGFHRALDWRVSREKGERGLGAEFFREGGRVVGWMAVGTNRIPASGGDVIVVKGRSGSGKTTLAEYLCDVMRGRAEPSLRAGRGQSRPELRLAYCSQFPTVLPAPLLENLAAGGDVPSSLSLLIERYGLAHLGGVSVLNETSLSGGERQRIGLIRVLARDLDVAILDEPTASVGALYRSRVLEDVIGLAKRGTLVVVVTHESTFDEVASRLLELE
jgi:ABC-type transport system involved in cytochrome bd biosynthesis fused ATPase/permease subunit